MRRYSVVALVLLCVAPALAGVRKTSTGDSDSTYDVATTLTYTTTANGKCGAATIINSDTDVAGFYMQGVTHCDASDVSSYTECSSAGDQIDTGTVQYWYNCDTDGDAVCDGGTTAYSATLLGRSDGSHLPGILKYDGSSPYDIFRTYDTVVQSTLTGVDLMDAAWHKIRYSWDNTAATGDRRKLCVDGYCDEDTTTSLVPYGAAAAATVGAGASGDPDVVRGAYDEWQFADSYDYTFASDGVGCGEAASVPTYVTGSGHAYGSRVTVTGCSTETEVEFRADGDASAALLATVRSTSWTGNIGAVFNQRMEGGGPDVDGNGANEIAARARCYVSGSPDTWSSFGQVYGGDMPAYLSTYASGMQRAEWQFYDTFERPDLSGNLEEGTSKNRWTATASCGMDLYSGTARKVTTTGCYSYTTAFNDEDQVVVARVDCPSCSFGSTGNTDFVIQLRVDNGGAGLDDYYQCKLEGAGTSGVSFKWNKYADVDDDSTVDPTEYGATCGDSGTLSLSFPLWVRCEVYDDPADATKTVLKAWTAPDSTGTPGTWTLRSTVEDKAATGTCNGTGWAGTGGNLTHAGKVGVGTLKGGDHRYTELAIGGLDTNRQEPRTRRAM